MSLITLNTSHFVIFAPMLQFLALIVISEAKKKKTLLKNQSLFQSILMNILYTLLSFFLIFVFFFIYYYIVVLLFSLFLFYKKNPSTKFQAFQMFRVIFALFLYTYIFVFLVLVEYWLLGDDEEN